MTRLFHGSGTSIENFDYAFTEVGNDQIGSGFYFTTSRAEAEGYATARLNSKVKPGGMLYPTIHEVTLGINNPVPSDHEMVFSQKLVYDIVMRSPILDECLEDWGDIEFEGKEKLVKEAIESYVTPDPVSTVKHFNMLSNDFYPGHPRAFFQAIKDILGFDGATSSFDNHKHFVAWFPEQITILHRHSLVEELIERHGEPEDDPVIHSNMLLYHGTDFQSATSILNDGIDLTKTTKGYFGIGFYCATDLALAKSNYADMADIDEGIPAVVAMQLKPGYRILDLRNEDDFRFYQENKLERVVPMDDGHILMRKKGVDGLYDRSFGGLVIYNPASVTLLGLVALDQHKRKPRNGPG